MPGCLLQVVLEFGVVATVPADLDPRGYLANASWLQNSVQISQLARLNCSDFPARGNAAMATRNGYFTIQVNVETLITTSVRSGPVRVFTTAECRHVPSLGLLPGV